MNHYMNHKCIIVPRFSSIYVLFPYSIAQITENMPIRRPIFTAAAAAKGLSIMLCHVMLVSSQSTLPPGSATPINLPDALNSLQAQISALGNTLTDAINNFQVQFQSVNSQIANLQNLVGTATAPSTALVSQLNQLQKAQADLACDFRTVIDSPSKPCLQGFSPLVSRI